MQTDFYKTCKVTDELSVINKTFLIQNHDTCLAKGVYQTPPHISAISSSTGIAFGIIQDLKKSDNCRFESLWCTLRLSFPWKNGILPSYQCKIASNSRTREQREHLLY